MARHVVQLAALGWRVVEIRPSVTAPTDDASLWYVTIARADLAARLTVTDADPEEALAELVRYASVDAAGGR